MTFKAKFLNPKTKRSAILPDDSFPQSRLLKERLSRLLRNFEVEVGFYIPPGADASPERVAELIAEEDEMRGR